MEDRTRVTYFLPQYKPVLTPIQTRILKLPEGVKLIRGEASPQQQSVFYCVNRSRMPPILDWIHRAFPRFEIKPVLTEELWVSRSDGRGMHEIGHVRIPSDPGRTTLGDIRWLPDGRKISFVYRNLLYVARVEPEK